MIFVPDRDEEPSPRSEPLPLSNDDAVDRQTEEIFRQYSKIRNREILALAALKEVSLVVRGFTIHYWVFSMRGDSNLIYNRNFYDRKSSNR